MRDISRKRRMKNALVIAITILILLIFRVGWIQFINGGELQSLAYEQQTLDRKINPKRGTIYDKNGNELAVSSTVYTITVNPVNIKENDKEKVAKVMSDIFELDYDKTLKKIKKRSSIETIARKQEKETSDKLRKWMLENNVESGINIDEDTKRFYPYNTLASHIIGFCGSDNQGLGGLEAKYDEILQGKKGRITKIKSASGGEIKGALENYSEAEEGKGIISTIDMTVQSIAEKYLEDACIDNKCTDGGNVIIEDPTTGDILAMATYPYYNLNKPYEVNNVEESNAEKSKALQAMWRNKAIADTYEQGSTFKLVTKSAALEEKIAEKDKQGA